MGMTSQNIDVTCTLVSHSCAVCDGPTSISWLELLRHLTYLVLCPVMSPAKSAR